MIITQRISFDLNWVNSGRRLLLLLVYDYCKELVYAFSAHRMLNDMKERFGKVNDSRIFYLHTETATSSQCTKVWEGRIVYIDFTTTLSK